MSQKNFLFKFSEENKFYTTVANNNYKKKAQKLTKCYEKQKQKQNKKRKK